MWPQELEKCHKSQKNPAIFVKPCFTLSKPHSTVLTAVYSPNPTLPDLTHVPIANVENTRKSFPPYELCSEKFSTSYCHVITLCADSLKIPLGRLLTIPNCSDFFQFIQLSTCSRTKQFPNLSYPNPRLINLSNPHWESPFWKS